MKASLFLIIIIIHDTVYLLRLILTAIEPSSACSALKAIFEQLEHKSKMRVIQTSMNADPCGCRVKSYSIVAMMPF